MSSGEEHEKAVKILATPLFFLVIFFFNFEIAVLFIISFIVGGIWLSPDLDTQSKPLKRWGGLKIIWFPYRTLIKHRSILSHFPIIGSLIRITYILGILVSISMTLSVFNINIIEINPEIILNFIQSHPDKIIPIGLGVEISAIIHLLQDNYFYI